MSKNASAADENAPQAQPEDPGERMARLLAQPELLKQWVENELAECAQVPHFEEAAKSFRRIVEMATIAERGRCARIAVRLAASAEAAAAERGESDERLYHCDISSAGMAQAIEARIRSGE